MNGAVAVTNLTKVYGHQSAVNDLTFEVPWGRVTGFLGPNGAGKTTTLRMILGLVAPTSGDCRIVGTRYKGLPDPTRAVGALLDTQQFHPLRSAINHLRIYAVQSNIPEKRVHQVLETVELTSDRSRKVGEFSLGMRQRLGLAAALLGEPQVLILDEPANGLDPSGIRWLRGLLRDYAIGDRAVFVSSHQLAEIAQVANEVVVIDHGRLVVHDEVAKLIAHAERGVRVRTEEPERLRDLVTATGGQAELISHEVVSVQGMSVEQIGRAAAGARIPIFALDLEVGTLEDVFFELTHKDSR